MASVIIHIPQYTRGKNPLMYLTGVHTDQVSAAKLPIKTCTFRMEMFHEVGVVMFASYRQETEKITPMHPGC